MPLYEYECRACGSTFERLILNRQSEVLCPQCESADITQLLSVFAVAGGSDKKAAEPGPCGACGASVRGSCQLNQN